MPRPPAYSKKVAGESAGALQDRGNLAAIIDGCLLATREQLLSELGTCFSQHVFSIGNGQSDKGQDSNFVQPPLKRVSSLYSEISADDIGTKSVQRPSMSAIVCASSPPISTICITDALQDGSVSITPSQASRDPSQAASEVKDALMQQFVQSVAFSSEVSNMGCASEASHGTQHTSRTTTSGQPEPLARWRHLLITILYPHRASSSLCIYNLHDVWVDYLEMLRDEDSAIQQEFAFTMAKVLSRRASFPARHRGRTWIPMLALSKNLPGAWENCLRSFPIHPHSLKRAVWVVILSVLLVYEAIAVPIHAFFDVGDIKFFNFMLWLGTALWTLDIVASLVTGVFVKGVVEMRPQVVVRRYVRTWFAFDVSLVLCDWAMIVLDTQLHNQDWVSYGVAIRGLRIIRLPRLLRFGKLQMMVRDVLEIRTKCVLVIFGLIKCVLTYVIISHCFACMWYAVGLIDANGWAHRCKAQGDIPRCYLSALQWAVAQIHGGSSHISYSSAEERSFGVVSRFLGLLGCAIFFGKVVDAVMQLASADNKDLWQRCTAYIERYKLPRELAHRLLRCVDANGFHAGGMADKLREEGDLLTICPPGLQTEIIEESRKPLLASLPVISDLEHVSHKMVHQLCCEATIASIGVSGEVIFAVGELSSHWRLVDFGSLVYVSGHAWSGLDSIVSVAPSRSRSGLHRAKSSHSLALNAGEPEATNSKQTRILKRMETKESIKSLESLTQGVVEVVGEGRGISEMVLWTPWVHSGNLIARSDCMLLQLSLEEFVRVLTVRTDTCVLAARYAQNFVRQMNSARSGSVSDLFKFQAHAGFGGDDLNLGYKHIVFLSHYKAEAGTEAALMQDALVALIDRESTEKYDSPVFLDSEDLKELTYLKDHVKTSRNLLLLLTPGVMLRPWCLVEIVTSIQHGVRIVPVEIQKPGVKFVYPGEDFYSKLRKGQLLSARDWRLLESESITREALEDALRYVFQQIALPFSPHKSKNIREAELMDILQRCIPEKKMVRKEKSTPVNSLAFGRRTSYR